MGNKAVIAAVLGIFMAGTMAITANAYAGGHKCGADGHQGMPGPEQDKSVSDLTAGQKAKLKAIGKAHAGEAKPLHAKAMAITKELQALTKAKAGDEAIKAKLAELTALRETLKGIHAKYRDQRLEVLTPTQQAQLAIKKGGHQCDKQCAKGCIKGKKGMKCQKPEAPDEAE